MFWTPRHLGMFLSGMLYLSINNFQTSVFMLKPSPRNRYPSQSMASVPFLLCLLLSHISQFASVSQSNLILDFNSATALKLELRMKKASLLVLSEERNPAGLSSCSGVLRPLVEPCVEPAMSHGVFRASRHRPRKCRTAACFRQSNR